MVNKLNNLEMGIDSSLSYCSITLFKKKKTGYLLFLKSNPDYNTVTPYKLTINYELYTLAAQQYEDQYGMDIEYGMMDPFTPFLSWLKSKGITIEDLKGQ